MPKGGKRKRPWLPKGVAKELERRKASGTGAAAFLESLAGKQGPVPVGKPKPVPRPKPAKGKLVRRQKFRLPSSTELRLATFLETQGLPSNKEEMVRALSTTGIKHPEKQASTIMAWRAQGKTARQIIDGLRASKPL